VDLVRLLNLSLAGDAFTSPLTIIMKSKGASKELVPQSHADLCVRVQAYSGLAIALFSTLHTANVCLAGLSPNLYNTTLVGHGHRR
jgi:hypothetical protein